MKTELSRRNFLAGLAVTAAAGSLAFSANGLAAAPDGAYQAPNQERELSGPLLTDLEAEAKKALEPGAFAFISGGAEKARTVRENVRAFDDWSLLPKYLSAKQAPDLRLKLLGHELGLPVLTCPMGAHGLAHVSGELGTARGTAAAGTLMTVSTAANHSLAEIAGASAGPKWYQIYLLENDRAGSRKMLEQARAAGYSAVVFTIDAFAPGTSDAVETMGFSFPRNLSMPISGTSTFKKSLGWDDVAFIRDSTDLPLILKGLLTPRLVERALKSGVAALQVSNHGGRQLDGVPAAVKALPAIAKAVGGQVPIILDSGIRRGSDVFKALALGASAVGLGRPVLYGLALGGAPGVAGVYARLKRELARAMTIAGTASLGEISRDFLSAETNPLQM